MPVEWPETVLERLRSALTKMPAPIRNMALQRLTEDVEAHLAITGRLTVDIEDVLLVARRMISGRMYEALEKMLLNGSSGEDNEAPYPPA